MRKQIKEKIKQDKALTDREWILLFKEINLDFRKVKKLLEVR